MTIKEWRDYHFFGLREASMIVEMGVEEFVKEILESNRNDAKLFFCGGSLDFKANGFDDISTGLLDAAEKNFPDENIKKEIGPQIENIHSLTGEARICAINDCSKVIYEKYDTLKIVII